MKKERIRVGETVTSSERGERATPELRVLWSDTFQYLGDEGMMRWDLIVAT